GGDGRSSRPVARPSVARRQMARDFCKTGGRLGPLGTFYHPAQPPEGRQGALIARSQATSSPRARYDRSSAPSSPFVSPFAYPRPTSRPEERDVPPDASASQDGTDSQGGPP